MFELLRITIKDFRSYYGEHTFSFPKTAGLYFLTGKNLVEPALGSNGAGKSTLLEAIVWTLYGHTMRGLKANEVLSDWGEKPAECELKLWVGHESLVIKRGQKPNYLTLNGTPLDQKELESHIRLNFDSFMCSVIKGQFNGSFMSLSPGDKLKLFSDIMGLDYWLDRAKLASDKAHNKEDEIDNFSKIILKISTQLKQVEEDIVVFDQASAEFGIKKQNDAKAIEQEIAKLRGTTKDLSQLAESFKAKLRRNEALVDDWLTHVQKAARDRSGLEGQIKVIQEQIDENGKLKGECPTCRQPVNKHIVHNHEISLMRKLTAVVLERTQIDEDLEMYKREMMKAKLRVEAATSDLRDIQNKETAERVKKDEISRLKERLSELMSLSNPYKELVSLRQVKRKQLKEGLAIDSRSKRQLEEEHAALSYWPKGFKAIRLFVIEQAFRSLELEVNNTLAQLGMMDWQITFDVERENKSGGVTKGFVTFIKGPKNPVPVRWENWSGGETQRLQLAGDLGLANLIMQQNGLTNMNEFYDEPSTHLSPEGMMALADMLHERAIAEGKRIWIVDHASITNFGEFQGVITIRKAENGSSITSH